MLPIIADTYPLDIALECRFIKFVKTVINSENELVTYLADKIKNNCNSTFGHNLRHIIVKYDLTLNDYITVPIGKIKNTLYKKWILNLDNDYVHSAIMVREISLLTGFYDEEQIAFLNNFFTVT